MSGQELEEVTPRHDVLTRLVREYLAQHGIGEPPRAEKLLARQKLRAYATQHGISESQLAFAGSKAQAEAASVTRDASARVYEDLSRRGLRNDDALWVSIMVGQGLGARRLYNYTLEIAEPAWRMFPLMRRRRRAEAKTLKAVLPELAGLVRGCPEEASDVSPESKRYGPNSDGVDRFLSALRRLNHEQVDRLSTAYLTSNAIFNTQLDEWSAFLERIRERAQVLGRTWAARRAEEAVKGAFASDAAGFAEPAAKAGALALVLRDDLDDESFGRLYTACNEVIPWETVRIMT